MEQDTWILTQHAAFDVDYFFQCKGITLIYPFIPLQSSDLPVGLLLSLLGFQLPS